MNENEMVQDDEISLFDMWEKLREGWRYVVGGAVIGLAGAGVALMVLPPKYEAVAVVQVGQVGQIGTSRVPGQMPSTAVEPASQAVERIRTPSFQRRAAELAGDRKWVEELVRSAGGITKDVSVQLVKGTVGPGQVPVIELRAQAEAPDLAEKRLQATISELVKAHRQFAEPMMEKLQNDLVSAREKLASAERALGELNRLIATAEAKVGRSESSQLTLLSSVRLQQQMDFVDQRQLVRALELALSPPATQPTKAIEAVFVGDRPVSPKRTLLIALGLVGGLLAGVVSVFFVDAWQRAKRERASRAVF